MVLQEVTQLGNPMLRAKAKPINATSKAAGKIVTDLIDSMRHHGLVGISAPQIGKGARIFVTELRKTKFRKKAQTDKLRIFINPRIRSFSKKQSKGWEGCGSVASANLFGITKRPASLLITAQDLSGATFELAAKSLLAQVIQHEMDHLNGKVFTDHADPKTYMSQTEYLRMRKKTAKS